MIQKLIMPINNAKLNSGYLNARYQQKFNLTHYGIDLGGSKTVWACGNGVVTHCGKDSLFGNVVVIVYDEAFIHGLNKTCKVVARCFHLASINVSAGQNVNKDTQIGVMGNTGKYSTGVHLHIEFDTDTDYPNYTAGLANSGTIIKKGNANTIINPLHVLNVKDNSPDNQTFVTSSNSDCVVAGEAENLPRIQNTEYVIETPKPPEKITYIPKDMVKSKGVDVSKYQSNIDYSKLKNSEFGDFSIIRVVSWGADGKPYVDSYAQSNYDNCISNGIKTGFYWITYAENEVECDMELELLIPFLQDKCFDMPVFIDVETDASARIGKDRLSQLIDYCLTKLQGLGYYVGIYANVNFVNNYIHKEVIDNYDLWLASYKEKDDNDYNHIIWQCGQDRLDGCGSSIDINFCYKDYSFIKENGHNNYGYNVQFDDKKETVLKVVSSVSCYSNVILSNKIKELEISKSYEVISVSNNKINGKNIVKIIVDNVVAFVELIVGKTELKNLIEEKDIYIAKLEENLEQVIQEKDMAVEKYLILDNKIKQIESILEV